ncbi:MAG: hypothetical protein RIC87_06790 [Kiloniellales bacterium]
MIENTSLTEALAHLQAGDWESAHKIVQADSSKEAAWLHAHLHRVEGDLANARYWYNRAGRDEAKGTLGSELAELKQALE